MVVIRTAYDFDEGLVEQAIKAYISDESVHSGTFETEKKARVARIVELVGVDNFYTGGQATEETVTDRLNTTEKTLVDVNMYDISKRPHTGAYQSKLVRFNGWVQLDICTFISRYHANSIKREIDGLIMTGIDMTYGDEIVGFDTTIKGELLGVPGKKENGGYWRSIIKIPLSGWTKGTI